MWVGIETTTLVTAFLICTYKTKQSLEATWKYLIVCSVGVSLALVGTLFIGAAAKDLTMEPFKVLSLTVLNANSKFLHPQYVKIGFIFLVVGYGTKAGLAPMHAWLPDAHSQAPAPVSAMILCFPIRRASRACPSVLFIL